MVAVNVGGGSTLERLGRALLVGGTFLAVVGMVRGGLLFWKQPETWQPRDPWIDAALLVVGLLAALAGFVLHHHAVATARATPATFLDAGDEKRVLEAIRTFESRTSGEIRVHLCGAAVPDILGAARGTFEQLGMTATRERNGVLFFVDVPARRFAVLGDAGIHDRVGPGFWDAIARGVEARFRAGDYADGLAWGIGEAGTALATFFPHRPDDVNELPDEISRG
jgi:uncharacterized membrane protein